MLRIILNNAAVKGVVTVSLLQQLYCSRFGCHAGWVEWLNRDQICSSCLLLRIPHK